LREAAQVLTEARGIFWQGWIARGRCPPGMPHNFHEEGLPVVTRQRVRLLAHTFKVPSSLVPGKRQRA
jgi:hypothetical protein